MKKKETKRKHEEIENEDLPVKKSKKVPAFNEVGKDIELEHGLKIVNHTPFDPEKQAAAVGDKITLQYAGKLAANNKEFDSGNIEFVIGKSTVVPGFEFGSVGLQVGGKRTIKIPSALGYGPQGAPPDIPKNANLIFEVQLKKIDSGSKKAKGKRQSSPKL